MSVKERLKQYIKYSGLKVNAFESSINASNGYVNSISKGIGNDKISLIVEKYPNLNIEWLITGEGDMLKKDDFSNTYHQPDGVQSTINEPVADYSVVQTNATTEIIRLKAQIDLLKGQLAEKDMKIIQLISRLDRISNNG